MRSRPTAKQIRSMIGRLTYLRQYHPAKLLYQHYIQSQRDQLADRLSRVDLLRASPVGATNSRPNDRLHSAHAMSETVCDLANAMANEPGPAPHRPENCCEPQDFWNQEHIPRGRVAPVPRPPATKRGYPHRQELPECLHNDLIHILPAKRQRFEPSLETVQEECVTDRPDAATPVPNLPDPDLPRMRAPLQQPPDEPSNAPLDSAVRHVNVFVDDFIGIAQGSRRHVRNLRRNILHAIDMVLDQPRPGETLRNKAASLKKLLQGNGSWNTRKLILRWTLELPAHRVQRLHDVFDSLRGKRHMSMRKWQKVLGELQFMSIGIPSSAGLFLFLQSICFPPSVVQHPTHLSPNPFSLWLMGRSQRYAKPGRTLYIPRAPALLLASPGTESGDIP